MWWSGLVRRFRPPPPRSPGIPGAGQIDADLLERFDAVVHLAGENIVARRWTQARRRRIWESHVASTKLLCRALTQLRYPPAVLVAASAAGYYGDVAGPVDEDAPSGAGFLAEMTAAWESGLRRGAGRRHPRRARPVRLGSQPQARAAATTAAGVSRRGRRCSRQWSAAVQRAGRGAAPAGVHAGTGRCHPRPVRRDGRSAHPQGAGGGPRAAYRAGVPLAGADPGRCAALGAGHTRGSGSGWDGPGPATSACVVINLGLFGHPLAGTPFGAALDL